MWQQSDSIGKYIAKLAEEKTTIGMIKWKISNKEERMAKRGK